MELRNGHQGTRVSLEMPGVARTGIAEMARRYYQDVEAFEAQSSAGSHRAGGPS